MTKLSSLGVAIAVATMSLLAGCQLYFGSSDSSGGGGGGSGVVSGGGGSAGSGTGSTGSGSGATPTGGQCAMDTQCAAGCFCANGVCTEGGFCGTDKDCGAGFHCDVSRSSCIPNSQCTADAQCGQGSVCDAATGGCATTCVCATDADAISAGFGWCDESRSTCMTGTDPAGMCLAPVSCTSGPPACPENQVALVKDGCFTGQCRAITACEGPPVCPELQHQDDCDARTSDCTSIFTGHNCHGTTCGVSDTDCTCETFTFAACDVKGTPVTMIPGN